jgi:capsular exopolysaccharide synthesis family protein
MSRVDEALRRAAEQAAAERAAGAPGVNGTTAGVVDMFPDEVPETPRELRSAPPPSDPSLVMDPTSAGAEPGPDAEPQAEEPRQGRSRRRPQGSIFDRIDSRLSEKVVIDHNIMPASREQYRHLAAVLHDAQGSKGLKVIMIVSATAGEGKTLTAANLALTFSESYQRRVLLIDADLRRPALHGVFRIDTASGLTDGLADPHAKLTVRQVSPRLAVLPAGRPSADPMAGLTSDRMRQLLSEARDSFDWVIIDTPPLGILPDAHLLASMVEGAVLVIRAGSTPHSLIRRAVEAVGRPRILGVVLNSAAGGSAKGEYGYDYYYGYGAREALPEKQ